MRKYDVTIVVRCSTELKQEIEKWAVKNRASAGEMTRRILETAFGIPGDHWQFPPAFRRSGHPHAQPRHNLRKVH